MSAEPKLLVIDDEQVVCESCSRIFTTQGFKVQTSTDSYQGLRMASENEYAVILLDFKMPVMDGIEFLEALRKANRNVPVIMITGYSTVQSAAAAMRMGACDYIPKPFTPEEILQAVERVVSPPVEELPAAADSSINSSTSIEATQVEPEAVVAAPAAPERKVSLAPSIAPAPAPEVVSWSPSHEDYLFFDCAWFRSRHDGLVRAGAFLSRTEGIAVQSVRLPQVGEVVYQGLPLAVFILGGKSHVIPSPVSGEVVAINRGLADHPAGVWDSPCQKGWVAQIRPSNLSRDLAAGRRRDVVVAAGDEATLAGLRHEMAHLGCKVHSRLSPADVLQALDETQAQLLVIDAESYGAKGPQLVEAVNVRHRHVKVVVFGNSESVWETAYRSRRILYYALQPFEDNEIIDILSAAFRPGTKPATAEPKSAFLPKAVHRIRLTDRNGHRVALLAPGTLLQPESGLGRQLIRALLEAGCPVEVDYGAKEYGPTDVLKEADAFDRLYLLKAEEMDRIPGTLARHAKRELPPALGENHDKVLTLALQPNANGAAPVAFDPAVARFLAQHIAQEMIGEVS